MKQFTPKERIIFPLDAPDWTTAEKLAGILANDVGWFKVGLELFVAEGPQVLAKLKKVAPAAKIFLDLKLHDIPATVGRAMKNVSSLGADLVTVHAQGGTEMLTEAVKNAGHSKVLAVTLLTSLDPMQLEEIKPEAQQKGALVEILARRALKAGCHGLVASGHEVTTLRAAFGPEPWLIIPGIRPQWSLVAGDDQKRVATPASALKDGADLLVIGRPIRDADDPRLAAQKVAEELA